MFAVPLRTLSPFSMLRFLVDVLPNIPESDTLLATLMLLPTPTIPVPPNASLLPCCVVERFKVCELLTPGRDRPTMFLMRISRTYSVSMDSTAHSLSGCASGEFDARHTRSTTSLNASLAFWLLAIPTVMSRANLPYK